MFLNKVLNIGYRAYVNLNLKNVDSQYGLVTASFIRLYRQETDSHQLLLVSTLFKFYIHI